MKKVICDKCKTEFLDWSFDVSSLSYTGRRTGLYQKDNTVYSSIDLCEKCRKELGDIIKNWLFK